MSLVCDICGAGKGSDVIKPDVVLTVASLNEKKKIYSHELLRLNFEALCETCTNSLIYGIEKEIKELKNPGLNTDKVALKKKSEELAELKQDKDEQIAELKARMNVCVFKSKAPAEPEIFREDTSKGPLDSI